MFPAVQRAGEGDPRSMTHQALTRSVRPDTEKMRLPLAWRVPRMLCCTLRRPAMPTPPRTGVLRVTALVTCVCRAHRAEEPLGRQTLIPTAPAPGL